MIKPLHTLFTLVTVALLCLLAMWLFPEEGIAVTDHYRLRFANMTLLFPVEKDSVSAQTAMIEMIMGGDENASDSIQKADSLKLVKLERQHQMLRIQYPNNAFQLMGPFFESLKNTKANGDKLRVLHYGDSQIEGDRITGYIRNELQKTYGGHGPGLVPVIEAIPSAAIVQDHSPNWFRHTVYGPADTTITHRRFGLLANFADYTPTGYKNLSSEKTWISYRPSPITYKLCKSYETARLYLGNVKGPTRIKVFDQNGLIDQADIDPDQSGTILNWNFDNTPSLLRFEFEGDSSPELCAVALEDESGVNVDNIPMRGSSGTIFKKMDYDQLKAQYAQSDVGLLLLQYGGNTVPYIKSKEQADQYGGWFKAQIKYLQGLLPGVPIIVIGPSDMAQKKLTEFVTYPYLVDVRDALKKAAFESGCAFWDIYEAMGGHNSMEKWVNHEPALAGLDYVHFTPKGARKIAQLFYTALSQDIQRWEQYLNVQEAIKALEIPGYPTSDSIPSPQTSSEAP